MQNLASEQKATQSISKIKCFLFLKKKRLSAGRIDANTSFYPSTTDKQITSILGKQKEEKKHWLDFESCKHLAIKMSDILRLFKNKSFEDQKE